MKVAWALALSLFDICAFVAAGWIYWHGDYAKAAYWLAMSISMELAATRAWRRATGKEAF